MYGSEIAIAPPSQAPAPIQFELVVSLTTANHELLQVAVLNTPMRPLPPGRLPVRPLWCASMSG